MATSSPAVPQADKDLVDSIVKPSGNGRLETFIRIIHELANAELEGVDGVVGNVTLEAARKHLEGLKDGDANKAELAKAILEYEKADRQTAEHREKIGSTRFTALQKGLDAIAAQKKVLAGVADLEEVVTKQQELNQLKKNTKPSPQQQTEMADLQSELEGMGSAKTLAELKKTVTTTFEAIKSVQTNLQPGSDVQENAAVAASLLGQPNLSLANEADEALLNTEVTDEVAAYTALKELGIFKSVELAKNELKSVKDQVRPTSYDKANLELQESQRRFQTIVAGQKSADKTVAKGGKRLDLERQAGEEAQRLVTKVRAEIDSLLAESDIVLGQLEMAGKTLLSAETTRAFAMMIVERLQRKELDRDISLDALKAEVKTIAANPAVLQQLFGGATTISPAHQQQLRTDAESIITVLEKATLRDSTTNATNAYLGAFKQKSAAKKAFDQAKAVELPNKLKELPQSLRGDVRKLSELFVEMESKDLKPTNNPEQDKQRALKLIEELEAELRTEQAQLAKTVSDLNFGDHEAKIHQNGAFLEECITLLERMAVEPPSEIKDVTSTHAKIQEAIDLFNLALRTEKNAKLIEQNMNSVLEKIGQLSVRLLNETVTAEDGAAKKLKTKAILDKASVSYDAMEDAKSTQKQPESKANLLKNVPKAEAVVADNVRETMTEVNKVLNS